MPADASQTAELLRTFADRFAESWAGRPPDVPTVVSLAAEAVPHADGVGLTFARDGQLPKSLAVSGPIASLVGDLENAVGDGPCIEALVDDDLVNAPDLETEGRWPEFVRRTLDESPVRSMFAVRVLIEGGDRGALNFYATQPEAFGDVDLGIGAVFSSVTSLVLHGEVNRSRAENLQVALESSRTIGTAMGILMSSRLMTAERAFDELRGASQRLNRKVRDVARDVVETGALPD